MGCVEWLRGVDRKGYGRTSEAGRMRLVHRVSWERSRGPIPDGMCVLHKCDNPRCFNVAHLFLGTNADNNRDMAGKMRQANQNTWKTRCSLGHPLEVRNTDKRTRRAAPHRFCRECANAKDRERRRCIRAQREERGNVVTEQRDGIATTYVRDLSAQREEVKHDWSCASDCECNFKKPAQREEGTVTYIGEVEPT